jgi:hypothetical protein
VGDLYYLNLIFLHILIAIIVNLPKQDKATKNWAILFGWAEAIMAVQVLVGWRASALGNLAITLSALNNLFYLGAALLLVENLGGGWRYLLSLRKFQLISLVSVLAVGLLALNWLLGVADPNLANWLRGVAIAVIALISIAVYLVEGVIYFYVLGMFRHKWIRYLPLLIALASSLLEFLIWSSWEYYRYALYMSGMRYLYYISAFMIVLTQTPQDIKDVFGAATRMREFILAKETGFVEAIGRYTAAHKVLILIKRPNFIPDESRPVADNFMHFGWHDKEREDANEDANSDEDDLLADIAEEECQRVYEVCQSNQYGACKFEDGKQTIVLPITMYGGMIGVLFVRLHKGVRTQGVLVEKLKHAVEVIFPVVQSSRQATAIGMLSDHFTTNLISDGATDRAESDDPAPSVTEGIDEMLKSLLETLSPLAVALKPSQHFNSEHPVLWQIDDSEFPADSKREFEQKYFSSEPDFTPFKDVFVPFQQELELGRLIMFVWQGKDTLNRPTIGIHENVFKALGALINNTLQTIIRRNLHGILRAADKQISKGGAGGRHIARVLQEAAQAFGLSWIVIALDQNRFFGDDERVASVRGRADLLADDGEFTPVTVTTADERKMWIIPATTSWESNSLSKNNGSARHRVDFWFGVEKSDFNWDEKQRRTWQGILGEFVQFGTNKIKDMLMKEMEIEIEEKITEIEKSKSIMTLVNLHGSLTHQFGTYVKEVECAIKNLELDIEELKLELPDSVEQDVAYLKESFSKLRRWMRRIIKDALGSETNTGDAEEEEHYCNLRKAIDNVLTDVELKSKRSNIAIHQNGPHGQEELPVEVPYYVVYLSIFNLIFNSIKALSNSADQLREKRIDVTTTVKGDGVFCRIKDTGQGIKDVERLYELDSGLGLYITKASLQDNNSTIKLLETGPSGTTFELRFPVSGRK